jgi:hypothetical protein
LNRPKTLLLTATRAALIALVALPLLLGVGCVGEIGADAPEFIEGEEGLTRTPSSAPWRSLATIISQGVPGRVTLSSAEPHIRYVHIRVLGSSQNVRKIYFAFHGDHVADYAGSTAADRTAMAQRLAPGEGALVVYPISRADAWPGFRDGINGEALIAMFRELEQATGKQGIRVELFGLSGACRVLYALLKTINNRYDSSADVRDFVDEHLRGIHNGDAFCNATPTMHEQYMAAINRYGKIRYAFVHSATSRFRYMYDYHAGIARAVGNVELAYGGEQTLANGRFRFWRGSSHFRAWAGQFDKVFFGTSWSGGATPNPDPNAPQTCYLGGKAGTCQLATQACEGTQAGVGCTRAGEVCCMPKSAGGDDPGAGGGDADPGAGGSSWGSCNSGGQTGTCQQDSSACAGGYYKSNLCPGPNSVRCCLRWGSCSFGGQTGTCQDSGEACSGSYKSNLCPGPSSIRCCVP